MSETAVETPEVEAEAVEEKPKREKKVVEPTPCASSLYHWVDDEGVKHDCGTQGSVTPRTFRPGHDAKLKSLLIKAAVAGKMVIKTTEDGEVEMEPLHAAEEYGFRNLVEKSVDAAKEKAEIRAAKLKEREEAKAKKAQEKADAKAKREQAVAQKKAHAEAVAKAAEDRKGQPGAAKAKVGRTVVDGEILADGTFKYKKGDEEVETTNYTPVIDPESITVEA